MSDFEVYPSITTSGTLHDAANMLTELLWLNKNPSLKEAPWRDFPKIWGKDVACIKKLINKFDLDKDQLAFYIYKCRPIEINGFEFGKMAIVARKLFRKYDLNSVVTIYAKTKKELETRGLDLVEHKKIKPKNLLEFLRDLEDGKE